MKKEFRIMYVILPGVLAVIVHFIFWYGNKFRPVHEWSDWAAGAGAVVMLVAMVFGVILAMTFYDDKPKN